MAEKFALVCLANYCQQDGRSTPTISEISFMMSASRKTVKRALQSLEEKGLIRREAHFTESGRQTSNTYYLALNEEIKRRNKAFEDEEKAHEEGGGGHPDPPPQFGEGGGGHPDPPIKSMYSEDKTSSLRTSYSEKKAAFAAVLDASGKTPKARPPSRRQTFSECRSIVLEAFAAAEIETAPTIPIINKWIKKLGTDPSGVEKFMDSIVARLSTVSDPIVFVHKCVDNQARGIGPTKKRRGFRRPLGKQEDHTIDAVIAKMKACGDEKSLLSLKRAGFPV